ncbi:MAG TPA: hypothetical protein VJL90_09375 [Pseudorhodoplanes sp.]|nr:hypothetical protein [Pseudorhodoplanes sp.]
MPIESIRLFVFWCSLLISTFLFVFSKTIREGIEIALQGFGIKADIVILAVFFVGLTSLFLARILSEAVPTWFPYLRKTMMGSRYIEGLWLDAVFDNDQKTVKHVGIINFEYSKGYLVARATDYDLNGHKRSSFQSIFSKMYDTGDFRYCWEAKVVGEIATHRGYGEYSFSVPSGLPSEFVGEYVSSARGAKHIIEGNQITDSLLELLKLDAKSFDLSNANYRTKLICAYAEFKKRKPPARK